MLKIVSKNLLEIAANKSDKFYLKLLVFPKGVLLQIDLFGNASMSHFLVIDKINMSIFQTVYSTSQVYSLETNTLY